MICSHFRSKNYEEESYFICLNQRTGKSSSSKDTTLVFGSSESVRHFSVTDATHERGKPSGETMSFTMSRSATCPRTFSLFAVSRRFRGPTVATTWNEFAKVIAMMRPANMRIRVMRVTQKMPRQPASFASWFSSVGKREAISSLFGLCTNFGIPRPQDMKNEIHCVKHWPMDRSPSRKSPCGREHLSFSKPTQFLCAHHKNAILTEMAPRSLD